MASSKSYSSRLDRCMQEMQTLGIERVVLTPGASMKYLTGFSEPAHERLLCLVISSDSNPYFIAPALNAEQAVGNPAGIVDIRSWRDDEGYTSLLCEAVKDSPGKIVLDDDMPARFVLSLLQTVDPALLSTAVPLISKLRAVKDADELDAMRRAAKLTDNAFLAALRECKAGVTARALADIIRSHVTSHGGELSFETIVAAGPNAALPHHHTGDTRIQEGDVVLFDLGAMVDDYCGDITRVVNVGSPSDRASYVYKVVYAAHKAAIEKVEVSAPAQHVDSAARMVIEDYGFGKEFIHRTGHGIGLETHEMPNIVQGNLDKLVRGNCFSVEPGIYLTGEFGIRLENIVALTESGCEVLNAPISPILLDVPELLAFYGV